MGDSDICGADTGNDWDCQNPAGENGRCWIPSHNPGDDNDNPAGRPTKLEAMEEAEAHELMENVAHVIEQGGSIAEAARKSTIHRETISRWMEMGEEKPEGHILREFYDRLVRARGEGEGNYRQILFRIAAEAEDTATLMAMLKQRYPETWGEVNRGEQAGGVVVNLGEEEEYEVDPESLEVEAMEPEGG